MIAPTVLLVEDNPDDDLLLRDLFAHLHSAYAVTTLTDGGAAVEYLSGEGCFSDREHYPIPSLVLLDVNLPGKSGLDVLDWLRRSPLSRDMPVVMISGSRSPNDIQRAYDLGTNFHLLKPLNLMGLHEAVSLVSVGQESSFHVLLIDDNADDRALATDELRRVFPAIRITEAEGRTAIKIALEREDFDLVITDYQMDEIDALTVLRTVKARRPDCPDSDNCSQPPGQ